MGRAAHRRAARAASSRGSWSAAAARSSRVRLRIMTGALTASGSTTRSSSVPGSCSEGPAACRSGVLLPAVPVGADPAECVLEPRTRHIASAYESLAAHAMGMNGKKRLFAREH